ncbi:MAG: hypothetical protein SF028_14185 [Candidatus Sumerlaeia bacterium]|nr:hypothetical protein [Candidatus Sumerlaeia bacterium]
MVDPAVERRFADCSELVDAWRSFLEHLTLALRTPDSITPTAEQNFLAVKARVAMLHDSFMDSLERDKQTGANMLQLVNRAITLRHLAKLGAADSKKMEIEWHEIYLLLSDTVTSLEEERVRLAGISAGQVRAAKMKEALFTSISRFVKGPAFKALIGLGVIFGLFASLFIFQDFFRTQKWSKDHYAKLMTLSRNHLGMGTPYKDAEEFVLAAFGPEVEKPAGVLEWNRSGLDLGQLANFLGQRLTDGGTLRDRINNAKNATGAVYDVVSSQRKVVNVGMVAFFNEGEAIMFEQEMRGKVAAEADSKFDVSRKVNVALVLHGDDREVRDMVRREVLQRVKPF